MKTHSHTSSIHGPSCSRSVSFSIRSKVPLYPCVCLYFIKLNNSCGSYCSRRKWMEMEKRWKGWNISEMVLRETGKVEERKKIRRVGLRCKTILHNKRYFCLLQINYYSSFSPCWQKFASQDPQGLSVSILPSFFATQHPYQKH